MHKLIKTAFITWLCLSLSGAWTSTIHAAEQTAAAIVDRPKIGLVLSGGGAMGGAHIGVLQVLEELNVPIDYIAGTSMGAVIGGLYAAGRSPDDIAQQVQRIDWERMFIDEPDRAERSQRRKIEDNNNLIKLKPRVKDGTVNIAPALIQGQRLGLELRKLVLPVAHIEDFDHLSIPFRAVATDAMRGEAVVLEKGDLAQAIRASMAVPMIFAPVEWEGKVLIDGGVVRNTPISVVRQMGAEIVIVVMLNGTPLQQEELNSPLAMLTQLSNLLTEPGVKAELATLTDRDVVINADLSGISPADFGRLEEAIPRGLKAAEAKTAELKLLAQGNTPAVRQTLAQPTPPVIEFIDLEHDADVSDEVLHARLDLETGKPLDFAELEAGISRLYGTDYFSRVDYEVIEKDGKQGVKIEAQQRPWGTSFIQGGMQLSADLEGDSFFNLGMSFTQRPMNLLGGEWRTGFSLGEEPSLATEWYQPLDPAERWFARSTLIYQTEKIRSYAEDLAETEYRASSYGVRLAGGRNFGTENSLTLGVERFVGTADVVIGAADAPEFDFDVGALSLSFLSDTLDNVNFPRNGNVARIGYRWSLEMLGADQDYEALDLVLYGVRSWGDHSVRAGFSYEGILDSNDLPIQARYSLGGFLNLSGLQENQISGEHAALLRTGYQYRLSAGPVPTYLGLSLETGNVWEDDPDWGDLRSSISAFIGADTPLGPVYLGYGLHEGDQHAVYLFLGQPWF